MEFARKTRNGMRGLPLTPLIDVVFILIIFFMLTTSFMKTESLELILPSKGGKAAEKQEVVRLLLFGDGTMKIGTRPVTSGALDESLKALFAKDASTKMMVLAGDGVTMQQMVNAMDRIYAAGGQSIFVRKGVGNK